MSESKKEKAGEVALHAAEAFQKLVLGFMPGGHAIEQFLDFRNSLKQKRVLNFSESMRLAMSDIKGIEPDVFTTEEFVDVFELIINRVQNTNSEFKLRRFRNILLKQIVQPVELFTTLQFVEIVNQMDDIHLLILDKIKAHPGLPQLKDFYVLFIDKKLQWTENASPNIEIKLAGNKTMIEKSEIRFYGNQLVSMGLIKTGYTTSKGKGIGSITSTYEYFEISEIGKKFLEFIKDYESI